MNVELYLYINHNLLCIIIYLSIMLSIVLIFSLSVTKHVNLNSNFRSRYSILFQCSSGPEEGEFC